MRLDGVDEFGGFHVEAAQGLSATQVADALGEHGSEAPDDHVWIRIASLRDWAPSDDDAWQRGFEAMVDYATSKGWTDDAGTHLRAHIERV